MIEKSHKLKSTPIKKTWPFLKYICCCIGNKKPNFNYALKRAIRRKLELSVPKSDIQIEEDPFLLLGYGMNSYLQVMVELMCLSGLISIVTIPLMSTFAGYGALKNFAGYDWNQYTLGNIGGADSWC